MLQQTTLGGAMIVLPLFLQMTLEYNAIQAGLLALAPLSLSMFGVAVLAGRKAASGARLTSSWPDSPSAPSAWPQSFPWCSRVDSGWYVVIPLVITGSGLGLLVSQLEQLHPRTHRRGTRR